MDERLPKRLEVADQFRDIDEVFAAMVLAAEQLGRFVICHVNGVDVTCAPGEAAETVRARWTRTLFLERMRARLREVQP